MTNKQVLPKDVVLEQAAIAGVLPIYPVPPANGNGAGEEATINELPTGPVSDDPWKSPPGDARPDPKPRKNPHLWQAYLWWYELMEMRKRHLLRISSIERGKSNLDSQFEKDMLEQAALDALLKNVKKTMTNFGKTTPVWEWATSIKGLGEGGLAAQLIAQIDDINNCPTVASLWRFAGFAVMDGKAEKNQKGEKSRFNRKLKGVCFNIADQFIKQQTPGYVDIYYTEKEHQRTLNPDVLCRQCSNGVLVKWDDCQSKKAHTKIMTDAHIHNRAWRKMIKAFLRDLWVEWKRSD